MDVCDNKSNPPSILGSSEDGAAVYKFRKSVSILSHRAEHATSRVTLLNRSKLTYFRSHRLRVFVGEL